MKNLRNKQTIATSKQFQTQNLSNALLTKVAGGQGRPAYLDRPMYWVYDGGVSIK